MSQPNTENQWHSINARNELSHIDYNAVQKLGANNPVSRKIKEAAAELDKIETLIKFHQLDSVLS